MVQEIVTREPELELAVFVVSNLKILEDGQVMVHEPWPAHVGKLEHPILTRRRSAKTNPVDVLPVRKPLAGVAEQQRLNLDGVGPGNQRLTNRDPIGVRPTHIEVGVLRVRAYIHSAFQNGNSRELPSIDQRFPDNIAFEEIGHQPTIRDVENMGPVVGNNPIVAAADFIHIFPSSDLAIPILKAEVLAKGISHRVSQSAGLAR